MALPNYNAQQLINVALQELGVLAVGETASADLSNQTLTRCNLMLDTWGATNLSVRATVQFTGLASGLSPYSIGSGGTFNTTRPMSIPTAAIVYLSSQNLTIPLDTTMPLSQYYMFSDRTFITGLPRLLFYDPQMPLGQIYLYPNPDQAYNLDLRLDVALSEIAALSTLFSLEPSYFNAIALNLAVEIAPGLVGANLTQQTIDNAKKLYKMLQRLTAPSMFIASDFGQGPKAADSIFTVQ